MYGAIEGSNTVAGKEVDTKAHAERVQATPEFLYRAGKELGKTAILLLFPTPESNQSES